MPHLDIRKLFHRFNELIIFIPTVLFVDSGHTTLGLWVDHALNGTVLSQVIAMLAVLGKRISHIGGPHRRLGPKEGNLDYRERTWTLRTAVSTAFLGREVP